jgi:nitrogen fixation protein FixH
MTAESKVDQARRSFLWPHAIFALLSLNVVICAITAYYALTDTSMAITTDYYEKALRWDDSARQLRFNAALGWKIAISSDGARVLKIELHDSRNEPIRSADVRAEVFHEAHPLQRTALQLGADHEGSFRAALPDGPAGLWHIRTRVDAVGTVFTDERTIEVVAPRLANGG